MQRLLEVKPELLRPDNKNKLLKPIIDLIYPYGITKPLRQEKVQNLAQLIPQDEEPLFQQLMKAVQYAYFDPDVTPEKTQQNILSLYVLADRWLENEDNPRDLEKIIAKMHHGIEQAILLTTLTLEKMTQILMPMLAIYETAPNEEFIKKNMGSGRSLATLKSIYQDQKRSDLLRTAILIAHRDPEPSNFEQNLSQVVAEAQKWLTTASAIDPHRAFIAKIVEDATAALELHRQAISELQALKQVTARVEQPEETPPYYQDITAIQPLLGKVQLQRWQELTSSYERDSDFPQLLEQALSSYSARQASTADQPHLQKIVDAANNWLAKPGPDSEQHWQLRSIVEEVKNLAEKDNYLLEAKEKAADPLVALLESLKLTLSTEAQGSNSTGIREMLKVFNDRHARRAR